MNGRENLNTNILFGSILMILLPQDIGILSKFIEYFLNIFLGDFSKEINGDSVSMAEPGSGSS